MHIRTILFPTDFSAASRGALEHAVGLALAFDAELHVLHVRALITDDPYNPEHHFPDHDAIDEVLTHFDAQELERLHVHDDVRVVRDSVRAVSPGPAIVEHAERIGADLIVMGTHGRTGLPHVLLGSVAEQVTRLAAQAVLTVGRRGGKSKRRGHYQTVVVGIDYSEQSKATLAAAAALAERFGGRLIVTHVIDEVPHPSYFIFGNESVVDLFPDLKARCETALDALIADVCPDAKGLERLVVEGKVHKKIDELAREHDADLIVIGARGHGGVEELLLGSVATKVLPMAPCPVLAVKGDSR